MSGHRRGEPKARRQVPEQYRRREGAYLVRTRYEPMVCDACDGFGDAVGMDVDDDTPCPVCGGEGEV